MTKEARGWLSSTSAYACAGLLLYAATAGLALAQEQAAPSPIISSISRDARESTVLIAGKSQPNFMVAVDVLSANNEQLFLAEAPVDPEGYWELSIPDKSFPAGEYTLRAIAHTPDGLVSAPRDIRGSKLAPQPVLTAGNVNVGWLDVIIILILIMVIAGAIFAWLHERSVRRHEIQRLITDRDMHGMCTKMCDEVGQLPELVKSAPGIDSRAALDIAGRIFELQKTVEKMQGYLSSEMRKF